MQGTQNNNAQGELMRGGNSANRWPHFLWPDRSHSSHIINVSAFILGEMGYL